MLEAEILLAGSSLQKQSNLVGEFINGVIQFIRLVRARRNSLRILEENVKCINHLGVQKEQFSETKFSRCFTKEL